MQRDAGMRRFKVDTIAVDGRSTTFAGVPAGAWFGEGAALKGEPRPYAVVAIRNSSVAFMPRDTFLWLIDDSRGFSRWVIDQLNVRLGHYVALIESFRLQDATARMAYCISELFNPRSIPPPIGSSPYRKKRSRASAACRARTRTGNCTSWRRRGSSRK